MWLGTEGGLVRFDGREFRAFDLRADPDEAPIAKDISTLRRGSNDVLWIGTWGGGLVRFDPVSERTVRYVRREQDARSLSDDRVQTVYEDRSGRIWVGTFNGLNRLDVRQGAFVRIPSGTGQPGALSHGRIWSIAQGSDGVIWVGTDAGVDALDAAGRVIAAYSLPMPSGLPGRSGPARVVFHDGTGALWVGGQRGLYRFDAAAGRFVAAAAAGQTLGSEIITSIAEGPDGSLWIGTLGQGLACLPPRRDRFIRYPGDPWRPGALSHGDVRDLWVDRTGLLWVATRGGGVSLLDLRTPVLEFVESASADGAWQEEVASLFEDSKGAFWAGSFSGVRRWDAAGRETRFEHDPARPDSLSPELVRAIAEDGAGRLWVGTLSGLDRLDPVTGRAEHFRHAPGDPGSLSSNRVSAALVDRRGRLWVGTQSGLNRLEPGTRGFTRFHAGEHGLSDDFVRVLLEDSSGAVWLGTEVGGVCRWRETDSRFDCFRHGSTPESLSDNRVFALHETEAGAIWVGTDNGLNLIEPRTGRVERWGADRGVPTTDVYGLQEDRAGTLWISSGRGLYRFDPETGRSRAFAEAPGLRALAFSRGASVARRDGTLVFGALTGAVRVFPERARAGSAPAPVVITAILVDEQPIPQPIGTLDELSLPWRSKSIRVAFASLDYQNPRAQEFAYRLEAFEDQWRRAGADATASYTNLDAGEYRLRVRASNGEGVWNEEGVSLPVHIRPPWWETMLFRLGIFVLMTTITATVVVGRVAMLKRGQRALGRIVDERTAQLVEANTQLEQLARTDGLTGLANYRAFSEALEGEWSRARRDGRALSVVMIDVDRFKTYNDTFGHRAGDDGLRQVAGAIGPLAKREGDMVARYGGDEFSMVLAGSDRQGALRIAEHARIGVEALDLRDSGAAEDRLTLSVGVATTRPTASGTTEDLLRAADQALYEAKRRGRNCVVSRVLVTSEAADDRVGG
jgi:diguanylate cyclase (GGDEF)-like protein